MYGYSPLIILLFTVKMDPIELKDMNPSDDEQLYHILTKDRMSLPLFLNGKTYADLIGMFQKITDAHDIGIRKLLLGDPTISHSIYELPTNELVTGIIRICSQFGIKMVEEIGAGTGLLAARLISAGLSVLPTDGHVWKETMNLGMKYTPVHSQYICDYLDPKIKRAGCCMVAWPPQNSMVMNRYGYVELWEYISHRLPYLFIWIGDPMYENRYAFYMYVRMRELGYRLITLPIKQICYKDSVDNMSHSVLTLCIHSDVKGGELVDKKSLLAVIGRENCHSEVRPMSYHRVVKDLIDDHQLPPWFQSVEDQQLIERVGIQLLRGKVIPETITTPEQLKKWAR